jgi:hypothetical protein
VLTKTDIDRGHKDKATAASKDIWQPSHSRHASARWRLVTPAGKDSIHGAGLASPRNIPIVLGYCGTISGTVYALVERMKWIAILLALATVGASRAQATPRGRPSFVGRGIKDHRPTKSLMTHASLGGRIRADNAGFWPNAQASFVDMTKRHLPKLLRDLEKRGQRELRVWNPAADDGAQTLLLAGAIDQTRR